jgi:SprT protein
LTLQPPLRSLPPDTNLAARTDAGALDAPQIEEQIHSTCAALDVDDLAHVIQWSWNRRLTRAIARAHFHSSLIELSSRLFPLLSLTDQRDTVIHETCHLVAHRLHGPSIAHHGREWRALMLKAGGMPRARSKSIEGADLLRGKNRVTYFCTCRSHAITAYRAAKIERGHIFVCTRCRAELSLTQRR